MEYIVFLGVALSLVASASYIVDTFKGKNKPNRVTWLIWSVAPIIATIAAVSDGVTWAILPTFMAGFGPLLVLIASFFNKQSYWKLTKGDYICGASALLALVLWWVTKDPNLAIFFSILADGLGATPTLIKAWRHPETESGLAYILYTLSPATGFLAIQKGDFSELAFNIYLFVLNASFCLIIYRKKIKGAFQKKPL